MFPWGRSSEKGDGFGQKIRNRFLYLKLKIAESNRFYLKSILKIDEVGMTGAFVMVRVTDGASHFYILLVPADIFYLDESSDLDSRHSFIRRCASFSYSFLFASQLSASSDRLSAVGVSFCADRSCCGTQQSRRPSDDLNTPAFAKPPGKGARSGRFV